MDAIYRPYLPKKPYSLPPDLNHLDRRQNCGNDMIDANEMQEALENLCNYCVHVFLHSGEHLWIFPLHFDVDFVHAYIFIDEEWQPYLLRRSLIHSFY